MSHVSRILCMVRLLLRLFLQVVWCWGVRLGAGLGCFVGQHADVGIIQPTAPSALHLPAGDK